MTKDEYDRRLKDAQEIEAQTGLKILTSYTHCNERTGEITEAGFSSPEGVVFRQRLPFTPDSTYSVDECLWRSIVYRDPTR